MSRETDTPSSGPNGRGGAAYPSGTPPYGIPAVSDDGAGAGRSAAQPEERKTETTLTTRIRINIPGSRPIPPVVVRKTVNEAEAEGQGAEGPGGAQGAQGSDGAKVPLPTRGSVRADGTGQGAGGDARTPAGAAGASGDAQSAAAAEEKATSDWFAPRKSQGKKAGQGGGGTNGAGLPGGSGAPANGSGTGPGASGTGPSGAGAPGGSRPAAGGRPGGVVGSMSVPGGPARAGSSGGGLPGATGGPVAPGHGGGTGSFDVTEALAAGARSGGSRPGGSGEPSRDDLPFFAESGRNGQSDRDGQSGHDTPNGPNGPGGGLSGFNGAGVPGGPGRPGGAQGPAGPTGGPVTGDGPLLPPTGGAPVTASGPSGPVGPAGPSGAPGAHTARPGGGLSDDTAILTPQQPAPESGTPGYAGRPDNVSGHTVTSGIPVVPAGTDSPFPSGSGGKPAPSYPLPKPPEPGRRGPAAPAKSTKAPKKKGRSKVALLGGVVVVVAGLAYGAGLLMNHSDVPKGTTVLGVDIGGGTRDDAVKKLDDAFGKQVSQPLKLSVDGKTVTLKPDQAGLQFDIQATASAAAKSDYNPVSVIGSLFGNHRVVEPRMPVDEEKLQAALQDAAGGAGSSADGTIKFEPGKAVAVYGRTGKGIDAARSVQAVEQAYRTQVETGTTAPVQVPTTTRKPTVSDAEVDRMMKAFAKPAMSAKVTVMTDPAHSVLFSPQKSLWKFLGVKAVDGKLVEYYDKAALKQLYGRAFDGVLITRGTGKKTPVTVEDVIGALRPALTSSTNRVGVIDTTPN
ncbi:hypothetical protein [Streptomyces sp. MK5]|uniref:hypothetical protein n=1 Tax=Streptomyces sp. MK5 TaxID=3064253 RepID=UPI0027423968|nr:hypothetical protein [Streptomyces sp. MK5]